MKRIFGTEIEYGLLIEGINPKEQLTCSMDFVRSFKGISFDKWDYRDEDPRADMRGFHVNQLQTDPQDAQFDSANAAHLNNREIHSDKILVNGSRLYNDHGHPEYSTPECVGIYDLIAHEKAGEQILNLCAIEYSRQVGKEVKLYKNNTDYHGASYGSHENYLISRSIPIETLTSSFTAFLTTRTIYAGAGKAGTDANAPKASYQLSQRADFMTELINIETLTQRPIVNTRDEPHADSNEWRRLHVICGDANMSDYSIALKLGVTRLVLELIEQGNEPKIELADPVNAFKQISRDLKFANEYELKNGTKETALNIQNQFYQAARLTFQGKDDETDFILDLWHDALLFVECYARHHQNLPISEKKEQAFRRVNDKLDWALKREIIQNYLDDNGINWDSDAAQSLDLMYHDIDIHSGLYYALTADGIVERLVTDAQIQKAMLKPPVNTRAFVRGLCVERFRERIESMSWNRIVYSENGKPKNIVLSHLVNSDISLLSTQISSAKSIAELASIIERVNQ